MYVYIYRVPSLEADILASGLISGSASLEDGSPPTLRMLEEVELLAGLFRRFRDTATSLRLANPRQFAEHVLRDWKLYEVGIQLAVRFSYLYGGLVCCMEV